MINASTNHNPKQRPTAKTLQSTAMRLISESPPTKVTADAFQFPREENNVGEESTCAQSRTFISSQSCSRQKNHTNTIESKMQSLQIRDHKTEFTCEEVHSATTVERVTSSGDLEERDEDEVSRLRWENTNLKATVFMLEQDISFLKEQVRMLLISSKNQNPETTK